MISISLCMIVKNEEEVIGRCLESVKDLVDEINIVDTGSTDKTKEIVSEFTDRIFDFEWIHNFAAARNFSFQQATKDYILWMDADDVFLEQDQEKLKQLKKTLSPEVDAVSMIYNLGFDDDGNVSALLRRNRLAKRSKNFQWVGEVHEFLAVHGNIFQSDIAVSHLPLSHDENRNIEIYRKMLDTGKEFTPRDMYYYANELADHGEYLEAIKKYEEFLETKQGWIEDNIRACFRIGDCYLELNEKDKAINAALRTFSYDLPRPEACCRIGFYYMEQNKNNEAIYWYKHALLHSDSVESSLSLQTPAFSTWLPHLQLCVLYDRLKDYKTAFMHNEMAGKYIPNSEKVLYNKKYFEKILFK
ncbi:MAG: glycosyltransferase [Rummeliibacillus sp.]